MRPIRDIGTGLRLAMTIGCADISEERDVVAIPAARPPAYAEA